MFSSLRLETLHVSNIVSSGRGNPRTHPSYNRRLQSPLPPEALVVAMSHLAGNLIQPHRKNIFPKAAERAHGW